MATRAGGARGGSGSRISPRLAQSLTSTGLPRLTVKELEENAAALRELAALQAAAKAKKAAVPALALPIAASSPRAEDAKAPTSSSDGVVGRIVLDEEEDVAALALENEQLRRLVAAGRSSPAQASQASIVALEAQAARTDQILQYLAVQVGTLAEKVSSGPSGSSPSALPAKEKQVPGSLPFLEPAHKRPGSIDLNTQRVGMYFYDSHIRPYGGARQSLTTRVGAKVTARSYNELLSLAVALDMAVVGVDARGPGEGGAQDAALLDVIEVLVRRWICVIYAALHKNDWAAADGFLHPRVRDTFLPVPLLASLGQQLRAQDFLDKRSGRSLAALDSEDDGEGDGIGSLTLGGDVKVSAAPNGRAKASKKQ